MKRALVRRALVIGLCAGATAAIGGGTAAASSAASHVSLAGTGFAQTGAFTPSGAAVTQNEFPTGDNAPGPDPYNGTISFSTGTGGGPSVPSRKKVKSNPTFDSGFEGLNHYQQRYSRGG